MQSTPFTPHRLSKPTEGEGSPPESPSPWKDAFVHIGKEVSQEAIVGITAAGVVAVGDSLGHPLAGRLLVAGLGAARGYLEYREDATAKMGSPVLGTAVAATLGASTTLLTGMTGNVIHGAGIGAVLGLVRAPKTFHHS